MSRQTLLAVTQSEDAIVHIHTAGPVDLMLGAACVLRALAELPSLRAGTRQLVKTLLIDLTGDENAMSKHFTDRNETTQ